MPKFLVVGTQKGGTSSLHYMLKSGWHKGIAINEGEKEIHYFSFDDNYAKGPTSYQQRWDGPGAVLGTCAAAGGKLRGEISATYLDYPKAAERAAALVPAAKIIILLREPVSRVVSSFNMRWQIEVCGKLTWTRPDCYRAVTSRDVVRDNAVGPFQKMAALKVWGKCADSQSHTLNVDCLRLDFLAKLRNRTRTEMGAMDECARRQPSEPLGACLGYRTLSQKKLYKALEDHAFLYRTVYAEHLQGWLRYYPPAQLLVFSSEALFGDASRLEAMGMLARFLELPESGPQVDQRVLSSPSPAATDGSPHENGRTYVVDEAPEDVAAPLRAWLCPKNQLLARLLERHRLMLPSDERTRRLAGRDGGTERMPWLTEALKECNGGDVTAGVADPGAAAAPAAQARGREHRRRAAQSRPG